MQRLVKEASMRSVTHWPDKQPGKLIAQLDDLDREAIKELKSDMKF